MHTAGFVPFDKIRLHSEFPCEDPDLCQITEFVHRAMIRNEKSAWEKVRFH